MNANGQCKWQNLVANFGTKQCNAMQLMSPDDQMLNQYVQTLPEAQRTKGIESIVLYWVISAAKKEQIQLKR